MKILVITPYIPMPDRGSGELRLFSLLQILAEGHQVSLYTWSWGQTVGSEAKSIYEKNILGNGVAHETGGLRALLKRERYDLIIFEWYYWVDWYFDDVKTWQPEARIIIDTVDIEFRRLSLQAAATGEYGPEELHERKKRELSAYKKADMLIAVSAEEKEILATEVPGKEIEVIPNIHRFPEFLPALAATPSVIFIGNFRHDPNLDAVRYFCSEIWPTVRAQVPTAKFSVVGNALPEDDPVFQIDGVEKIGYVSDTAPYLARSRVSVAPLRFGAGVKGKVGEAIAAGVPVVTTSIGAQGMPLTPGTDLIVADVPDDFASAVVRLLTDMDACERQRQSAWHRLKEEFGFEAVRGRVDDVLTHARNLKARPLPIIRRWACRLNCSFDDHLRWRLPKYFHSQISPTRDSRSASRVEKKEI